MTWQNIKPVGNLMLLALATAAPLSGMAESGPQYSYSDEWSIVSAPPPSGPFRSIHLDPRIPGQGIAPPAVSTPFDDIPEQQAGSDAGMTSLPPPAAGIVDHAPPVADAEAAPMPSPGLLPPPPGPADLSAPSVAGAAAPPMAPPGLLPPPPGPTDLPAPPVAGVEMAPPDGMVPPLLEPEELPAPPVAGVELAPPEGMLPPLLEPEEMPAPPVAGAEPPLAPPGMLPPLPGPEEMPAPPVAGAEPPPMAPPGMLPPLPGPEEMPAPPVAGVEPPPLAPPGMLPPLPGPEELPAPPVAGAEPPPMAPPGLLPPVRSEYKDMPSTAAGRVDRRAARADIKPATRPPLTRQYGRRAPPTEDYDYPRYGRPQATEPPVYGQYGRRMPRPRGNYNYWAPARQYGRSGAPGYRDTPAYGYQREPAEWQEEEVPPPTAYPAPSYRGGHVYP